MIEPLIVGNKKIGNEHPIFIIAEIGINHEGNVKKCAEMIKAAASSGVDAVKLQTINADANYVKGTDSYKVFKDSELNSYETKQMFDLAASLNLVIFTTVGDFETLEWVKELNPCVWKISSGLITHLPLIERIAKLEQPTLFSTGLSELDEIEEAVNTFYKNGNRQIGIFQCTSIYPLRPDNIYLHRIVDFKEKFNVNIGFSDHSLGSEAAFLSVGLGASMIEKHFTYDKTRKGYDHSISMNEEDMKELVNRIRLAEIMMNKGDPHYKTLQKGKRDKALRCLVAKKNIEKGELFTEENLTIKRPLPNNRGLEPKYYKKVLNTFSKREYEIDDPINNNA